MPTIEKTDIGVTAADIDHWRPVYLVWAQAIVADAGLAGQWRTGYASNGTSRIRLVVEQMVSKLSGSPAEGQEDR
jgi:hypothetical protein